ncbi:Na+/H+ antiporter NhaC [Vagococcus vulneris]|uniref:Na+/H+ antiporter NhaC n=1 Tax=Vagococcus vulneris TaxID=1977869 RepID=A0A429ZWG3_9ENTE|nr:Na+/H+ antiporter NhaC [Vagococcus vulneris]
MNKTVSFKESVGILLVILVTIGTSIIGFKLPAHVGILFSIILMVGFMKYKHASWDDLHEGIVEGVKPGIIPIILFILIGSLIGLWIAVGTIPTIMVYGFSFLTPKFFLSAVFLICALIGASVGSSFTTISTVGIAFVGMGKIMGFELSQIAGAIVSGAFLGNVVSPLSDTANLAAATADVDLFDHLKNVFKTAIPTMIISFVFYLLIGHQSLKSHNTKDIQILIGTLRSHFTISFIVLIPVIILLLCAWRKIPAIPSLLLNIFLSIILIKIYQPSIPLLKIGNWIQDGYIANTHNEIVDALLSRGGIQSMMWSVSLIILALSLGGLLLKMSIIDIILENIGGGLNSTWKVILVTALTCLGVNLLIGEQYLSIILPGEAYKKTFNKLRIPSVYLSRTLCDAGSTINPLIPWGVSAVFITSTLGVPTMSYLPYAIFCYVLPLVTILFGFFIKVEN